jgi:hypothetical protein
VEEAFRVDDAAVRDRKDDGRAFCGRGVEFQLRIFERGEPATTAKREIALERRNRGCAGAAATAAGGTRYAV